ncbi:cytochrome P450 [Oryctes borbonicus]|uniref:Cytochrome P450 n=1 Tax=Oryctes borbonicus TaxID=1629725 RepID=A0A0T6BAW8_9SCAR|nr:cytochrome P450 [Oryctes borbonicus]
MFSLFDIVAAISAITFLFVLYVKWCHTYWSRWNMPTAVQINSILGHTENPFTGKQGLLLRVKDCYDEFRRRELKHGGIYFFTQPIYMPVDTELIKNILNKDFSHFLGHGFKFNEKINPLLMHLFNLEGEKWRNMRVKLTPTFTSGKMKGMFKTLVDCGVPMIDHVNKLSQNGENLDIKEILSCYTTDIIGSCAFGLECNSFEDPDAEFRRYGRKLLTPGLRTIAIQFLSFMVSDKIVGSLPFKRLDIEIENFFISAIRNIFNYRTTNNIKRGDFIQIFMEMQEKAKANRTKPMTIEEISAQAFVFFIAGFETSSTTMTFCLHELAFNQDIQEKVREEIREAYKKNDGHLTYDAVMEMKYMDKVIDETLRKYPPVGLLNRVCSIDYNVPNTDVTIKAGTKVFISSLGIHRDPKYYPDPEKFDPERFSDENKAKRPPCTFLPFGDGPRTCIGLRFGLMQTKTGLSMLLNNYRIFPSKGEQYNIEFNPKSFILTKKGNVMLRAEKL